MQRLEATLPPRLRCTLAALGGTLAAVLPIAPATAQQDTGQGQAPVQERPVMLVVGGNVTWDDNLFRVPHTQPVQSDRISSAYVGVRVDKPYGQQRLLFNVTETAYRYQKLSYLDFEALDYRGAWQWRLGPRVSGVLSADRSEAQVNYADTTDTSQRNLRTTQNQRFSVDGWVSGGWHLVASALRREQRDSVPTVQQANYQEAGAEGGVRFDAGSGSSLTFYVRSLDGEYIGQVADPVNFIDDGFKRDETELLATWAISGKTNLQGRLAYVDYRSNEFVQRDFSGTAGDITLLWTPAAALRIGVTASRRLEPWRDTTASYRVEDRLTLAPVWQVGAKTSVRMSLDLAASDYFNPVVATTGPLREDTLRSVLLGADWVPARNLLLSATLQREERNSNDAAFDYRATVAKISASLAF